MEFPVLFSLFVVGFCSLGFYIYHVLWLRPEKTRRKLMRQGIRGPTPSFFYGNILEIKRIESCKKVRAEEKQISHDFTLFSYFDIWRKQYGSTFVFSTGNKLTVYIADPDLVKEIISCTSLDLGRPTSTKKNRGALFGDSVISANGLSWAQQRKIIAPEFFMDKVKGTVDLMVEATLSMLSSWEARVEFEEKGADITVDKDLKQLSADVISRACFGSNYSKGKEIFSKLKAIQRALSAQHYLTTLPGFRYIPNKNNREIWKLDREIHSLVLKLVNERRGGGDKEKDLLQKILEGSGDVGSTKSDHFIVDNCKAIFFAGHETTASTAKWVLVLLALNPEWQMRVRAELNEICGSQIPDINMLRRMKLLTMVIQETMRLYSTTPFILRETLQEMKFGDVWFPKGITISIPISSLQQDPEIWGPDAKQFNPERFANGASSACKFPHLYMPFGIGPRICLGQNFAMVELKVILSLILTRFTFAISPSYRHSVVYRLVLEHEHGANLLVKKL